MSDDQPRMTREKRTIAAMIRIYCHDHHHADRELCRACRELLDYAYRRLDCCRFGADKPPCSKCPVHCYKPAMRDEVRQVMRYAGPRMLLKHPVLAAMHVVDGRQDEGGE